jgi:hypothetical protein
MVPPPGIGQFMAGMDMAFMKAISANRGHTQLRMILVYVMLAFRYQEGKS